MPCYIFLAGIKYELRKVTEVRYDLKTHLLASKVYKKLKKRQGIYKKLRKLQAQLKTKHLAQLLLVRGVIFGAELDFEHCQWLGIQTQLM